VYIITCIFRQNVSIFRYLLPAVNRSRIIYHDTSSETFLEEAIEDNQVQIGF